MHALPSCETAETVMQRIAVELGAVAGDLSAIEARVLALVGDRPGDDVEGLQAIDKLSQQLRALEAFLFAAAPCPCGRIDVEAALDHVWLEGVRARLGGAVVAAAVAGETELW